MRKKPFLNLAIFICLTSFFPIQKIRANISEKGKVIREIRNGDFEWYQLMEFSNPIRGKVFQITKFLPTNEIYWQTRYHHFQPLFDCYGNIELNSSGNILLHIFHSLNKCHLVTVKYSPFGEMIWLQWAQTPEKETITETDLYKILGGKNADRLPYQPGWPIHEIISIFTTGQSLNAADFNPIDLQQELAYCYVTKVFAWEHDGTHLPGWPIDPQFNYRGCAMVVEDTAGKLAFACAEDEGIVYIYQHNASVEPNWPVRLNGFMSHSPIRKNVDADSVTEITAATGSPSYTASIMNPDASLLPNFPIPLSQNATGYAVGDVNNDGLLEWVISSTTLWNKRIWVISTVTGQILYQWQPTGMNGIASENYPALADLDGDEDLEIILSGYGDIICWHHYGSVYWGPNSAGGEVVGQNAVADIDNNNDLEIAVCGHTQVFVFNHDGTGYPGAWPCHIPNGSWVWSSCEVGGPAIGDIDNDGQQEIIANGYARSHWFVKAWEANGANVHGFPAIEPMQYVPASTPVICDADIDGMVEIASYGENHSGACTLRVAMYDLGTPYNPNQMAWPMLQHDPQRTGSYVDLPHNYILNALYDFNNTYLFPNKLNLRSFPNPFNNDTEISFYLPKDGYIDLTIYDINGQEAEPLLTGYFYSGEQKVKFKGQRLSSGVYFAVLQTEDFSQVLKLLILK